MERDSFETDSREKPHDEDPPLISNILPMALPICKKWLSTASWKKWPGRNSLGSQSSSNSSHSHVIFMISKSQILIFSPSNLTNVLVSVSYNTFRFIKAVSNTFPLFMVLSWVYASAMIVKSVVLEKEFRLKEVMKVMGCSNSVIWTAWFVDNLAVMTVSSIILSLILKVSKLYFQFSMFKF